MQSYKRLSNTLAENCYPKSTWAQMRRVQINAIPIKRIMGALLNTLRGLSRRRHKTRLYNFSQHYLKITQRQLLGVKPNSPISTGILPQMSIVQPMLKTRFYEKAITTLTEIIVQCKVKLYNL